MGLPSNKQARQPAVQPTSQPAIYPLTNQPTILPAGPPINIHASQPTKTKQHPFKSKPMPTGAEANQTANQPCNQGAIQQSNHLTGCWSEWNLNEQTTHERMNKRTHERMNTRLLEILSELHEDWVKEKMKGIKKAMNGWMNGEINESTYPWFHESTIGSHEIIKLAGCGVCVILFTCFI